MRTAVAVACAVMVSACNDAEPDDEATHRLLDTPAANEPTPTATLVNGATDQATPQPTERVFPRECSEVVSAVDVANIVAAPIPGFVPIYQNEFGAESGRLERLTCSYGTESGDDDEDEDGGDRPALEFAISSYVDAEAAAARVEDTVGSARLEGEDVEEIEIGQRTVFVLAGSDAVSYVLAVHDWTYVVTLAHDVVPSEAEPVVLDQLVEQLLSATT